MGCGFNGSSIGLLNCLPRDYLTFDAISHEIAKYHSSKGSGLNLHLESRNNVACMKTRKEILGVFGMSHSLSTVYGLKAHSRLGKELELNQQMKFLRC